VVTVVFMLLGRTSSGTGIQTAAAPQGVLDRDRGRIAVTSKPDGSTALVSIDVPLEGKFDGLAERAFILRRAAEAPPALQGIGKAEAGGRGSFIDSLRLSFDDGQLWAFVTTAASTDTRRAIPSNAHVVEVDLIIQTWAVRPDNPLMAPGSAGTGRSSHEGLVKDVFSRPNLP
jgi:hypothetical protein